MIGKTFGQLKVTDYVGSHISASGKKLRQYRCDCRCGASYFAFEMSLLKGRVENCGCVNNTFHVKKDPDDLRREKARARRKRRRERKKRMITVHL